MRRLLLTGITLAALGIAATASAQTAVTTMDVTMLVNAECTVQANPLTFPPTLVDAAPPTAVTTVEVTCSTGTAFTIAMDAGLYYDGSTRRMWDGSGNFIAYAIDLPNGSGEWGDGSTYPAGNAYASPVLGTNGMLPFNVNGRITGAGPYIPGTYDDSVVVTVQY